MAIAHKPTGRSTDCEPMSSWPTPATHPSSHCNRRLSQQPFPGLENTYSTRLYGQRRVTECCFSKVKQFRRIATRYEKTAVSFLGFLALAAAKLWMPTYVNRT